MTLTYSVLYTMYCGYAFHLKQINTYDSHVLYRLNYKHFFIYFLLLELTLKIIVSANVNNNISWPNFYDIINELK